MKFSFPLIKKLVPTAKNKRELIKKLNAHFFEAEEAGGNALEISIPPNRFSDAASHWGIAKEISAIYSRNFRTQNPKPKTQNLGSAKAPFKIEIQNKKLCPRYMAQYFEKVKIGPSPKWMKGVLIDCGLRPINSVVDIMNYAMLETGQPLHAFDYDKLTQSADRKAQIIVRRAKKGEKITTLDDKIYQLDENILVIAGGFKMDSRKKLEKDSGAVLAIAGIKGGKNAEVDKNTKRIIVESANFNGANIYRASKILKLSTDASLRFSHNISPELTAMGLNRAAQLLLEIAGARAGQIADVNFVKARKKFIKFDLDKFNEFIGLRLDIKSCRKYLELLGFKISRPPSIIRNQSSFLVEVPAIRCDIEVFEDLAEEIMRLYGYDRLESSPPRIHLTPSGFEDRIILKDKARKILIGTGLNEVSNYAFIGEADLAFGKEWKNTTVELANPISSQFKYLRPSLTVGLLKNIESNLRFFDEVKIFEIGNVFFKKKDDKLAEKLTLGIVLASKNKKHAFFELKGIIKEFFGKVGLSDYLMPEIDKGDNFLQPGEILKIESGRVVIGYLGGINKDFIKDNAALAEIDLGRLLKLVSEEHEYRPLSKYPSMMRDVSILVEPGARVGEIIQAIQESDLKYIEDVDLIDEFELELKRSLTFRVIFQAENRTLTEQEVNREMEKIVKMLKSRFKAGIR